MPNRTPREAPGCIHVLVIAGMTGTSMVRPSEGARTIQMCYLRPIDFGGSRIHLHPLRGGGEIA